MDELIRKQDALDAFCLDNRMLLPRNSGRTGTYVKMVMDNIKALPPVQTEIIHCKDCKFYGRADKRRFYRGSDCLNKRIDTIVPDRDFCSRAERGKAE